MARILPGGDKNSGFNTYLDRIADFASNLKDDDGNLIPVLFRPFHEQNGGWFWWGQQRLPKANMQSCTDTLLNICGTLRESTTSCMYFPEWSV